MRASALAVQKWDKIQKLDDPVQNPSALRTTFTFRLGCQGSPACGNSLPLCALFGPCVSRTSLRSED
jgi:hypothetical protein